MKGCCSDRGRFGVQTCQIDDDRWGDYDDRRAEADTAGARLQEDTPSAGEEAWCCNAWAEVVDRILANAQARNCFHAGKLRAQVARIRRLVILITSECLRTLTSEKLTLVVVARRVTASNSKRVGHRGALVEEANDEGSYDVHDVQDSKDQDQEEAEASTDEQNDRMVAA